MRFHCAVIVLAFLVAFASDSWGQSKRNTSPREEAKTAQQSAPADQRGTEQSPAFVKIIPARKTAEEAEADRKDKEQKDTNDTRLVWFTGLLAGIGFLQLLVFGWQGIQLKRSVTAAKEVSELGNREFVATHRPRVILRYIDGPYANDQGYQFVATVFVNVGPSDAIIDAFGGDLAYRGGFKEAWEVPGLDADLKEITPVTLVCGQRHVFTVTARTDFNDALVSKSAWPGFQTCAVGMVRYRDGKGTSRHTGFFRVLDDEGQRFVVSEHDAEMEYQD